MTNDREIADAAETIRQGGLVAFPTETVYGLGANALNADAVAKIFQLKGRPRFDPLITHIADADQLKDLAKAVPKLAAELIAKFWPGPLSLVLEKQNCVPEIVTAGLANFAVRCPAHELARSLIRAAGVPLAAPSANRFGMVSPTTAEHVRQQFGIETPTVLDGGPCQVGVESTVISFVENTDGSPVVLRPGGITLEQIERAIGPVQCRAPQTAGANSSTNPPPQPTPSSPGQLASHYAPVTPLILTTDDPPANDNRRVGLLAFPRSRVWQPVRGRRAIVGQRRSERSGGQFIRSRPSAGCQQPGLHLRAPRPRSRPGPRHHGSSPPSRRVES